MTSSHSSAFSPDSTKVAAHPIVSRLRTGGVARALKAPVPGASPAAARLARLAALLATIIVVVALCGAFWWRAVEFALTLIRG